MDKMISVTETVKRRYLKQGIFFTIIGLLGLGVELTNVQRTMHSIVVNSNMCSSFSNSLYEKN